MTSPSFAWLELKVRYWNDPFKEQWKKTRRRKKPEKQIAAAVVVAEACSSRETCDLLIGKTLFIKSGGRFEMLHGGGKFQVTASQQLWKLLAVAET